MRGKSGGGARGVRQHVRAGSEQCQSHQLPFQRCTDQPLRAKGQQAQQRGWCTTKAKVSSASATTIPAAFLICQARNEACRTPATQANSSAAQSSRLRVCASHTPCQQCTMMACRTPCTEPAQARHLPLSKAPQRTSSCFCIAVPASLSWRCLVASVARVSTCSQQRGVAAAAAAAVRVCANLQPTARGGGSSSSSSSQGMRELATNRQEVLHHMHCTML